jgi:tetratricopeptide (TPR) repeat protein
MCAVILGVLAGGGAAAAPQDRDLTTCLNDKAELESRLAACTRVINSRQPAQSRAFAFASRGGLVAIHKRDFASAIADLDQALRLQPGWPGFIQIRASVHMQAQQYDAAIADYDQLIRRDPKRAGAAAYYDRGVLYGKKGDDDRAIRDHSEAIRLDPKHAAAYRDRSWIYGQRGDHAQAIRDLDEAIRLEPAHLFAYINRGDQHWKRGEFDRAIRDFDEALKIDPGKALIWVNRGIAFQSKGDTERALADYRKALSVARSGAEDEWASATARDRIAALSVSPAAPMVTAPAQTAPGAGIAPAASLAVNTERRVALVIGNSAYKAVSVLPNPLRDAAAVAATLRGIGFATVRLERDLPRDKLTDALRSFAREAASADWAVIYFAGHGLEINGTNYLVPVDARLETDRDVPYEALPLDQVTGAVEGARKLRLVILDACRDSPFVRGMRRTVATRSIGRGLARIEPEGGTLVAYAAKNGEVALDGEGANSPFVDALLKHLPTPGLEIGMLFRHVRDDVMAATDRRQEPFVYGSLPAGGFYFVAK